MTAPPGMENLVDVLQAVSAAWRAITAYEPRISPEQGFQAGFSAGMDYASEKLHAVREAQR